MAKTTDANAGSPPSEVRELTHTERVRAGVAYWLFVVACLAFSGAGWFLVYVEGKPVREARPVPATIEHVEVVPTKDGHGHSSSRLLIIYSYSIGGSRYTTDRLTSLARPHSGAWTAQMAHRFDSGQKVTAHVSPMDPGSAFLVQDYDWRAYAFAIVPLFCALALAVYWPRSGIRVQQTP
jgi:Protein of unknown function (DUF3592)